MSVSKMYTGNPYVSGTSIDEQSICSLPYEERVHQLRMAKNTVTHNEREKGNVDRRLASQATRISKKEKVLFYHFEEQLGKRWIVCWHCHSGGQYDRKTANTRKRFDGRLGPSSTDDPLQPLRTHIKMHGGALACERLLDVTDLFETAGQAPGSLDVVGALNDKVDPPKPAPSREQALSAEIRELKALLARQTARQELEEQGSVNGP